MPLATTQERWRAVLARDRRYDGTFVYAVRSTGVYCRPSCPSRRPRPQQVQFFIEAAAAQNAGFRPCKRCRPDDLDPTLHLVRRACSLVDTQAGAPLTTAQLARAMAVEPRRLLRAFRHILGVTPRQYSDERRIARFKTNLRNGTRITPALYEAGYGGSSRVYGQSNARLGMTPATYARGGRGVIIRFAVARGPVGRFLIAATDRGVCRVALGDAATDLQRDLRHEFPAAELRRDSHRLAAAAAALAAHMRGERLDPALPLDVRATAFQRRVWDALRAIPRGQTRTYAAIAAAIGRPRATRAVARACAANPLAVLIPCHRVIRSDGSLGGYRWGLVRKERLLALERRDSGRTAAETGTPPRVRRN